MIATSVTIGNCDYDLETPNDLLYSAVQRFEIKRTPHYLATDLEDTALVTLIVSWKGFTMTRHYSVPWTGSSGYAVVFPDFSNLGYKDLWALYTEASVEVKLYGVTLVAGTMRVASEAARDFDTLQLGDGSACDLDLIWLDDHGTRFLVPVVAQSVSNQGKSTGYSQADSFPTHAGAVSVFRRWREVTRSVTLTTMPVAAGQVEYLVTIGETPFLEIRNRRTGETYLYDEVAVGAVNVSGGLATATISVSGIKSPLI